ncbi:chromosome segregation protein SMC [Ferviditalea candida]|uniref:Chromosome partition protein Smc n=1 Tax=Ferviditalea candida TaxID=3108399 RepID=A0ABU5ZFB2_9BACL|nr:chromosome segregation protein SMC [Paenibacillaceae bacterium T2]
MFLKRIELTGFKSFADKTELEFVTGITAVVGPNGSGKSNISDGIRWVLGEQSAKSLRGGKMEDVIFAGSVTRKPVNYGEVSLSLDNSDKALPLDFSEVTVTRRIHRSGESEYFINKQSCRLKDITELFMDTGIGREAYSIIGQGRIEEILSSRSEERRGIFEEASGIVKYKSRKKEAQKKLDETEQNLVRIHDLVSELEDQIEPLRKQSENAVLYKQLKEQLKANEISMYVLQIEQLHRSWQEAGEKLELLKQQQLKLSTVVSSHDAQLEKHRLETRRLEEELEHLQAVFLQLSEEFEKCEGFGEVLKERRRNLERNREQYAQTLELQRKRIAERTSERDDLVEKLGSISRKLEDLMVSLEEEQRRLEGVHGGTSVAREEELKGELLEILNKMAQARNEIRYYEQQSESAERRIGRLQEERSKWTEQLRQMEERKEHYGKHLHRIAEEIEGIRSRYAETGQQLKQKQALLDEVLLTARKWEQKLDALVSRRDTMLELQNEYDGFQQGVREVLKAGKPSGGLKGVHGAVAELVKVPEQYETAVETALGAALQHIVMENEASAREAIQYLKRRQSGRATLLPLNVIKGRSIPDNDRRTAERVEGFVGIAVDLVDFEDRYNDIFRNLLGNVIISENLEQANRIAASCQYRFRVVTLEGDVVNAGGSMTGGSQQKRNANLLGRKRQIEQLDEEIGQAKEQLGKLKENVKSVRQELEQLQSSLEQLRQLGEQKRLEEQRNLAEQKQLLNEYQNAQDQLELLGQESDGNSQEKREYEVRKAELTAGLAAFQEQEAAVQQAVRDAESERKRNESVKEELQTALTRLKVEAAAVSQEKQSAEDQLRRMNEDLRELQEEEKSVCQLSLQADRELAANREETVQQTENLNSYQLQKRECAETIDRKKTERAEWIRKLEEEADETKEQRIELRKIEEQMHQTEVRVNRLDVELDNLLKKLSEDYEISFEMARERYPVPEDVIGTQAIVRDLKRQIAQLGDVNLGAIDEYQRVNERYSFLNEQKLDLIEAKTTLYQVIREMDEEMSRRFRETFEAIRSHFVVVFAKLFGGGRADLILTDPELLLETGVEIVAQPPGKKLQNLSLLSGGERALTAIALLFAILLVKPVPFCVLDEVEAALDDANVTRFAQYLREFSSETQFIVVTHRKGTMEEADVLYGVTMEEDGVSKLVSVRLEDQEAASA